MNQCKVQRINGKWAVTPLSPDIEAREVETFAEALEIVLSAQEPVNA